LDKTFEHKQDTDKGLECNSHMSKIFRYELRRALLNKLYICLLIINGIYAWFVLSTQIVIGAAFTAPFSTWSFGAFLAGVMPMAILTTLFLLSIYYSKNAKQAEALTSATPVDTAMYTLIKNAAVTLGFLLICVIAIILCVIFYGTVFNYWHFARFILPAIVIIVPGFVFFMGLGRWLGGIRPWLLYVLIPVSLGLTSIRMPGVLDFFGTEYFNNYPLGLPVGTDGEPAFVFSAMFLLVRVLYLVAGGILWAVSLQPPAREGS